LVDDLLDFVSSENVMGKPVAADLKLGLATAPVLFAADQVDFLFSVSKYVNIIVRILHQLNVLYEEHFECESVKLIDKDVCKHSCL